MNELAPLIVIIYLICHIPAFILLIIGLAILKFKPKTSKILFIIAGCYFIVGGGICGAILS